MNCSKHVDRDPVGMCVRCHKLVCEECAVTLDNRIYCKQCISDMFSNNISNARVNIEKAKRDTKDINSARIDISYEEVIPEGSYIDTKGYLENDTLNLIKDNVETKNENNTVYTSKNTIKTINLVMAVLAILVLIPTIFSNLISIPYILEDFTFTMRYYGVFRGLTYMINLIITIMQPLILILLAMLLINKFIKINRVAAILAPIAIAIGLTIVRFITLQLTFNYFNFNLFSDMFIYVISAIFISIGNILDKSTE